MKTTMIQVKEMKTTTHQVGQMKTTFRQFGQIQWNACLAEITNLVAHLPATRTIPHSPSPPKIGMTIKLRFMRGLENMKIYLTSNKLCINEDKTSLLESMNRQRMCKVKGDPPYLSCTK